MTGEQALVQIANDIHWFRVLMFWWIIIGAIYFVLAVFLAIAKFMKN